VVADALFGYWEDICQRVRGLYAASANPLQWATGGSPDGQIVYHFPVCRSQHPSDILMRWYLQGVKGAFSAASSGQILLSAGLGVLNFVGALVLGSLLADGIAAELGGLVAFVQEFTGCYWAVRLWACRWYVISGFSGAIARLAITINSGKHGRGS